VLFLAAERNDPPAQSAGDARRRANRLDELHNGMRGLAPGDVDSVLTRVLRCDA